MSRARKEWMADAGKSLKKTSHKAKHEKAEHSKNALKRSRAHLSETLKSFH